MHTDAPAAEINPKLQELQLTKPDDPLYFPGTQLLQRVAAVLTTLVAPEVVAYLPAGQAVHVAIPLPVVTVPGPHGLHAEA